MWKKNIVTRFILSTTLLISSAWTVTVAPQYPMPLNKYVSDYVGTLQPDETKNLVAKLIACERNLGVECTVVVINSVDSYAQNMRLEQFATNLFNTWGIGSRFKNNGVLLLVALQDRAARIELGAGYKLAHNHIASSVINTVMLPLFKQGKPQQAIIAGTEAIITRLGQEPSALGLLSLGLFFYLLLLAILLIVVIAYFAIREAWRHDTTYGVPPIEQGPVKKSWSQRWFGVHKYPYYARSHSSASRGGSFGGGQSSGGGASGRW